MFSTVSISSIEIRASVSAHRPYDMLLWPMTIVQMALCPCHDKYYQVSSTILVLGPLFVLFFSVTKTYFCSLRKMWFIAA